MSDTWQTIVSSKKKFISGTLLSRLSGMARDMSMAYAFGAQPLVAIFLLAFRFSHLFRRLFGEGALQSAFIPLYEELRHQNTLQAAKFFRNISVAIGLFLSVLIAVLMGLLMASSKFFALSSETRDLLSLTTYMMPGLLFICLFGLYMGLLQCHKVYFIPAAAPVAFNLIWIGGVLLVSKLPIYTALYILSCLVVVAALFQWAVTIPFTLAILKEMGLKNFWSDIHIRSLELRKLLIPLTLGVGGVAATQVNNALDGLFSWWADPSGPAYLWYAIRLQQIPMALWGVALSGALLPPLCRAIKEKNFILFKKFLSKSIESTFLWMPIATAWLFVGGYISLSFLYGYGDFSSSDLVQTTYCCWGYGLGLTPMILALIFSSAFYAQKNYVVPMKASIYSVVTNIFLNFLFVKIFLWGSMSIALATSISALVNVISLQHSLAQEDKIASNFFSHRSYIMCSIFAAIAALLSEYLFFGNCLTYALVFRETLLDLSFLERVTRLIVLSIPFTLSAYISFKIFIQNKVISEAVS